MQKSKKEKANDIAELARKRRQGHTTADFAWGASAPLIDAIRIGRGSSWQGWPVGGGLPFLQSPVMKLSNGSDYLAITTPNNPGNFGNFYSRVFSTQNMNPSNSVTDFQTYGFTLTISMNATFNIYLSDTDNFYIGGPSSSPIFLIPTTGTCLVLGRDFVCVYVNGVQQNASNHTIVTSPYKIYVKESPKGFIAFKVNDGIQYTWPFPTTSNVRTVVSALWDGNANGTTFANITLS
jgi:hypothetical protein